MTQHGDQPLPLDNQTVKVITKWNDAHLVKAVTLRRVYDAANPRP